MDEIRTLTPLNNNYDPPQPWQCMSSADHACSGVVIGAMGSIPVCEAGAVAERAQRQADRTRIQLWANSPEGRHTLALEFAMERSIESDTHRKGDL